MADELLEAGPANGRTFARSCSCSHGETGIETNIQDLPESLVLRIFHFVSGQRIFNLFRMKLVCKTWYRLAEDCSLWRKVCFPDCDGFSYDVLKRILSWGGIVTEVNLTNCFLVNDDCLEMIAQKCPSLENLELKGCRLVTGSGLNAIRRKCGSLEHISLTVFKTNVAPFTLKEFISCSSKLRHVEIVCESEEDSSEAHFFLTNEFLDAVQENKTLQMLSCHNAGIVEEETNLAGHWKFGLRELGLSGCVELSNPVLSLICNTSPDLTTLDVSYCSGIDDGGIAIVAQFCPNLQRLIVQACPCVTDVSIQCIAENCKNLQYLNVSGCELPRPAGNITDVAVWSVACNCVDLRHLNVKWCQGVTDNGIMAVATTCTKLRHLNICGCLGISDVSIKVVAAVCEDLQSLEISECLRITRSSINEVVQNCSKLQYLDMQVCSYVKDLYLDGNSKLLLSLHHLDLSYCTKITDGCLKQFATSCPGLTYLSIAGCHRITDAGVKCLCHNCKKLEYLDASFRGSQSYAQITTDSMTALATNCLNLTYLDVIGCWNISEASIEMVVKSCRYLKHLNVSQFTENLDSQLLFRILNCISNYRSSCSFEKMTSPPRGGKIVQNFLLKMSAPCL